MTRVLREIKDEKGHVIQTQEEEVPDVQPKSIQKPIVMDVSSPQQHPPSTLKYIETSPSPSPSPSPASTPSSSVKITDDVSTSDKVTVKKKPGVSTSRND